MKNRLFVVWLLLLAGCSNEGQLKALTTDSVILAFGASLTYGSGVARDDSYPAVLGRMTQVTVVNAGVPGEISEAGLRRLPGLLAQHRPDLVLISHGGNDILRKLDPLETEQNLTQMIRLIRESGAQAVLIAIPKPALFPAAAPFYERVANQLNVPMEADIVTELQLDPGYKSDAIHFNAQGYALMAEAVAALLRDQGALP